MNKVEFAVRWLRIISVWLICRRNDDDVQQVIDKINEVAKKLVEESGKTKSL
jgi:hypothetical protein